MNTHLCVQEIADKHGLRRSGHRFTGPCPFCSGSKRSDKFSLVSESGGWKCYACGEKGDLVSFLRKDFGLNCPDAHEKAGRECKTPDSCKSENCRFSTRRGQAPQKASRRPTAPQPFRARVQERELPTISPSFPKAIWVQWAEAFVAKAHDRLLENKEEMAYLASRGIPRAAVERFSLGWHPHVEMVPFATVGLTPFFDEQKDKQVNKLWVPLGLVIPIDDFGGGLHRLRIRRPQSEREKSLPKLKYQWLRGSGKLPMVITPTSGKVRGAVIVEAELDAIAIAHAHSEVAVISIGSLGAGIDPDLKKSLDNTPVILVALDAEKKSANAIGMWKRAFRHARECFTPEAKDPGDYCQQGGDLHAWIEAALPAKSSVKAPQPPSKNVEKQEELPTPLPSPAPVQDAQSSSALAQTGGRGKENISGVIVSLSDGSELYVLPEQNAEYYALRKAGHRVVTGEDLHHIKVAIATEEENRLAAANLAIDTLEIFGGHSMASRSGAVEQGAE